MIRFAFEKLFPVGFSIALFAAFMTTAGCAAPGRTRVAALDLHASSPHRVTIHEASVSVQSLGRKLRSLGANRHTRLMVHLPQNADPATGPLLLEHLVSLGYPKVVLARKKPPQVAVEGSAGRK